MSSSTRTEKRPAPVNHLNSIRAEFDDQRLVADAGVLLASTLMNRLGLEDLVDNTLDLGKRPGASRPGRKVSSLIAAMLLGADSIDDAEVLRSGSTERLLGHRAMAPSTLGTFLRSHTFGHVRQVDRVLDQALKRAWEAGAGPEDKRLTIDIDSFVAEVHGYTKQGASYGYTKKRGYHPLIASRAGTSEVLHIRQRKGSANTQRGAFRFVTELLARCRRAGANGEILIRADSGFWNNRVMEFLDSRGCTYSIGVRSNPRISELITEIPEGAWQDVSDYPEDGICQVAETHLGHRRLIVRRVHLDAQENQTKLFTYWRYFAFLTNRGEEIHRVDKEHRQHAEVELVIRDLKDSALAHFPSASFAANSAWAVIGALAHNLSCWVNQLGLKESVPRRTRTLRRRYLAIPGRLTSSARRWTLHLPARWPWRKAFIEALTRIRALPVFA